MVITNKDNMKLTQLKKKIMLYREEGILKRILEDTDQDLLIAEGFDDAVLGLEHNSSRLIYSVSIGLEILIDQEGMNTQDAFDHLNYNVIGKYALGDLTPIWCCDI
tara:strand:+ start:1466 stop:1783 length:318 start_codon:yes stop_codon:yes gene_type:complete